MPLKLYLLLGLMLGWLNACATLGVPTEAQSAFEHGLALFHQGRYAEAVPHFQRATELESGFGTAYLYLGRSFLNLGQWLQAIPPIRTAFRLAPAESRQEVTQLLLDALLGGATASLKGGHFGESVGLLREALTLAPQAQDIQTHLLTALLGLGGQWLAQGKLTEAIATFTEVTQLRPQQVEGYLGLARALWQQGDLFKALAATNKALTLAPDNSQVRSFWQQLQGR
ncbi:MAG: tetratricopeptide repeat protein [Candidatus Tectimicrobiota bacterium]